ERLPLALPAPIEDAALVKLVKQAGKQAKDSIRVEVPFEVVKPEEKDIWSGNCGSELAIPLGRAGANRLQYVRLGKGTAQHLLVAGKTGSGKSTFLHALVTSGALHFSPDELRFYLVDFKKGVEFKSYATNRLPHADVIAIESEREFGLSVLDRLDQELRRRGEKFRAAGVQNLADYRADHPGEAMPRILLVVDEFQELFVEDDKLAQDAGLLLDRLVRQGRAFGMHVLLGSQTLSGAYSLARSTLGQMAVRVALQCSEADSHLILSDERNQAARFLSRPGEAIYNDQNGLVSANQPFQVVWLPDRLRAQELEKLNEFREARDMPITEPIVFEGNAPADPLRNVELMKLLSDSPSANGSPANEAWLGSAVAIKPPTSVRFQPHGGSNVLAVGQQPAAALGVMTTAVVSLAAASPKARFVVLDGSRPEDVGHGVWQQIADALGSQAEMVSQRELPTVMNDLAQELARRDESSDEGAPPIYLVVHNASRFRDLRKSEDDFSFSMDADKPPAVDKQFAEILKNGPQWSMHTLVWCDGYNAVSRLFDRLAMREFEMRVVFQMSAADSSNLIDTPAASKLSPHRALLYNDETGISEKFRPYGIPADDWLQAVTTHLAQRTSVDEPLESQ
ncbi:MAG: FtsK/SpoIIIE domain-containing protein, partial [Bacteroidota bacterium]